MSAFLQSPLDNASRLSYLLDMASPFAEVIDSELYVMSGAAAVTLDDASLTAVVSTAVHGDASITLDAATDSATGTVLVQGAGATTLGAASDSAAGTVKVQGAGANTLDDTTDTGTGIARATGTGSNTLDEATDSATGTSKIQGAAADTLDAATNSATGAVLVQGTGAVTLDAATDAAAGIVRATGTTTVTLDAATLIATGGALVQGVADVTLGAARVVAVGNVRTNGTVAVTLAGVTLSASAVTTIRGAAAIALAGASVSASGVVLAAGTAAGQAEVTLGNATVEAAGISAAIPWGTVEDALYDYVYAASNLDDNGVIWDHEGSERPQAPYMSLVISHIANPARDWVDKKRTPGTPAGHEVTIKSRGHRYCTLTIQCFAYNMVGHFGPMALLHNVVSQLPNYRRALRKAGIGVAGFTPISTIGNARLGTVLEARAVVELQFYLASQVINFETNIESAVVTRKLKPSSLPDKVSTLYVPNTGGVLSVPLDDAVVGIIGMVPAQGQSSATTAGASVIGAGTVS